MKLYSETYFSAGGCSDQAPAVLMPAVHGGSRRLRVRPVSTTRSHSAPALASLISGDRHHCPDGTAQTMIAARSNGNAYIKMDMGDAGSLVYILKDGQGYLVDDASKMAVRGEVPTVSTSDG